MNRRELARGGIIGLCGLLFGCKAVVEPVMLSTWGTNSDVTYHSWHTGFWDDPDEDGYTLEDGEAIE